MSLRFVIRPKANEAIMLAERRYESERDGLGGEFFDKVTEAFYAIQADPLRFKIVDAFGPTVRRAKTERFEFYIYFYVDEEMIAIVCFAHQRSDPDKWVQKIREELDAIETEQ